MKNLSITLVTSILVLAGCASKYKNPEIAATDKKILGTLPTEDEPELTPLVEFRGIQVTGVALASDGRMFASFPRWRKDVPFSVVEILPDGRHSPYPNDEWNEWKGEASKEKFTSVQSILVDGNSLFVLDSSNPENKKVLGKAKLFEFNLVGDELKNVWEFDSKIAPENSNLADMRIDHKNQQVFITDSGLGGIVSLDLKTGVAKRLLDKHPSTKAENVTLTVDKELYLLKNGDRPKVHSEGIAISPVDNKLYYHALTGYQLYRVPTKELSQTVRDETQLVKKIEKLGVTPAPDGMIFDKKGNLYMADLERNAVSYRTPDGDMKILIQDERIQWPDSFVIDEKNNLIFTDSLMQTARIGDRVDDKTFRIYKVSLPQ